MKNRAAQFAALALIASVSSAIGLFGANAAFLAPAHAAPTINVTSACLGTTTPCLSDIFGIEIAGEIYDVDFEFASFDTLNPLGDFPLFGDESRARTAVETIVGLLNSAPVPNRVVSQAGGALVVSTDFAIPFEFNPIFADPTVSVVRANGFTSAPSFNNWQVLSGVGDANASTGEAMFATLALVSSTPPGGDGGAGDPSSIPEPATISTLAAGLAGISFVAWRRRKRNARS